MAIHALLVGGVLGWIVPVDALTFVVPAGPFGVFSDGGHWAWIVAPGLLGLALDSDEEVIEELTERLRRAAAGDQSVSFDLDRGDELGQLADALDDYATTARECEAELDSKTTLLDSLFEQLPAHVYVKDEEGRHVRTTTPYSYQEYSRDESYFIGKTDLEIYPEQAAQEWYEDDMQVIEDGEPVIDRTEYDPAMEEWMVTSKVPWLDEDGTVRGLIGISLPITEQKKREFALESLHETTQQLLGVESIAAAAQIVVDAAPSILDAEALAIYEYDERANALEPLAVSEAYDAVYGGAVTPVEPDTDSVLWQAYVTGTFNVVDDTSSTENGPFATNKGLVVPLGSHGVLVAVLGDGESEMATNQLAETIGATTEAVFDRLDTESTLREHETEIETQNERLRRQVRINETIRSVDRSLIGAQSRDALETAVCEGLADGDEIAFAWIGSLDTAGDELQRRARAGNDEGYLDAVSFDRTASPTEPAVETALSGSPTLVETVAANVQEAVWRRSALSANIQSALAVPIALDEYSYGVLAVYATESDALTDLEATVFTELGASIANAITSLTTKQALHADTVLSLTLRIEETEDLLVDIARSTGGTVRYEGLATLSEEVTRLFVRNTETAPSAVADVLDARYDVTDHRLVRRTDGAAVFELSVQSMPLVARLVRHGGRPQSVTADEHGMDVVVEVPTSTDVRSFVEMLEETATVELNGRQEKTRTDPTDHMAADVLVEALTERQREVLRTAYYAGFFNWPRDTTGQELAAMLDVSQPTVNRHLRLGQQAIARHLFEGSVDDEES